MRIQFALVIIVLLANICWSTSDIPSTHSNKNPDHQQGTDPSSPSTHDLTDNSSSQEEDDNDKNDSTDYDYKYRNYKQQGPTPHVEQLNETPYAGEIFIIVAPHMIAVKRNDSQNVWIKDEVIDNKVHLYTMNSSIYLHSSAMIVGIRYLNGANDTNFNCLEDAVDKRIPVSSCTGHLQVIALNSLPDWTGQCELNDRPHHNWSKHPEHHRRGDHDHHDHRRQRQHSHEDHDNHRHPFDHRQKAHHDDNHSHDLHDGKHQHGKGHQNGVHPRGSGFGQLNRQESHEEEEEQKTPQPELSKREQKRLEKARRKELKRKERSRRNDHKEEQKNDNKNGPHRHQPKDDDTHKVTEFFATFKLFDGNNQTSQARIHSKGLDREQSDVIKHIGNQVLKEGRRFHRQNEN